MAKKRKQTPEEEAETPAPLNEYAREMEYEKSLPKPERRAYRKIKRKQRFADWVDKHWFPFLLFCALIIFSSAITILLAFYNKL